MGKKLLIIGAGGHGRTVADIANNMEIWSEISFLDDNISNPDVIGKTEDFLMHKDNYEIFVAIGDNKTRESMINELVIQGIKMPIIIHPSVIMGEKVKVLEGTVLMPGVIINHSCEVGVGCIINTGVIIEHDCFVDNFVHLSPGSRLAGSVKVGRGSWIGIGGVISNNIEICKECIIGAGAVVIIDIHEPGTYVGVPAKRITL